MQIPGRHPGPAGGEAGSGVQQPVVRGPPGDAGGAYSLRSTALEDIWPPSSTPFFFITFFNWSLLGSGKTTERPSGHVAELSVGSNHLSADPAGYCRQRIPLSANNDRSVLSFLIRAPDFSFLFSVPFAGTFGAVMNSALL